MGFRLVNASQVLSGHFPGQYQLIGAMQSPNYLPGSAGWAIKGDGSVEFNNGTFRGNLTANSISNTSIGSSTFQGGTVSQSTITEPDITFDSGGGELLVYATTSVVTSYTSSGSFVVPAGITQLKAECVGGGAGGYNGAIVGPGGGGGEYAAETTLAVTPGETLTVTVGAGGSAGTLSQTVPGTGGTSTIKRGATALVTANGGGTSSTGTAPGGTGSANSVHFNGGASPFPSGAGNLTVGGPGGGGSGGSASAGNNGAVNSGNAAGAGGAAVTGGGAGGNGGSGAGAQGTAGGAGSAPGGGGGSGGIGSNGNGNDGGSGAHGQVVITYVSAQTLIGSIASAAGSDAAGNQFPQGFMGSMVAVQPGSSPQDAETWHAMTLQNAWSNQGGTNVSAQFRRNALNRVEIIGLITHASISGSSQIATLPTGYRPTHDQTIGGIAAVPNGYITIIASTGAVIVNNLSSNTNIGFDGSYSLDA